MKHRLILSLLLLGLFSLAGTYYDTAALQKHGKNAGLKGTSCQIGKTCDYYWKISGIKPGTYSLQLEIYGMPANCLYVNGVRIDFDSASPIRKGISIAQTAFVQVDNGDEIHFKPRRNCKVGALRLAKQRLDYAPQKMIEKRAGDRDIRFTFTGTSLGEELKINLQNRTGRKQQLKLEVRILDFFRLPVAEYTEDITVDRAFQKTFDYAKGGSDQYRAIVKVTDSTGQSYDEVFPYLRDWSGTYRSKIWLVNTWQRTSVKDDGTRKTRTIQPLPPKGARWRTVNLPMDFPNHIAWFKRQFTIPEAFAGQRWFVHFDRIAYEADIYVNGTKVHHYGTESSFAPFDVEITKQLRRKGQNELLLAVRGKIAGIADEELDKKDYNKRNTKFLSRSAQGVSEICLLGVPETFIDSVKVMTSYRKKTLEVQADTPAGCSVSHRVLHLNREVLKLKDKAVWADPILWGPLDFPLLRLESSLVRNGKVIDIKNTRFGFREIWADGMTLKWNGQNCRLAARPFLSSWGWLLPYGSAQRKPVLDRIRLVKKLGNNGIRHIYDGSYFAEFADEEGMLFIQGGCVSASGPSKTMVANETLWRHKAASDLALIKAYFNYPSIFEWNVSGEMGAGSPKSLFPEKFIRVRDAVRLVRQADPTRFAEAQCDLDLHGECRIISTHYPVEGRMLRENETYLPDMAYWRDISKPFTIGDKVPNGQIKSVCNIAGDSPITWGVKPIICNEIGWVWFYHPPFGYTRIMGDTVFNSFDYTDFGQLLTMKLAFQGTRDAGASLITPWRWFSSDDNDFTLPALDLVVIQKYHTFVPGTKVVYDVNIFHDLMKKETLNYYWKLMDGDRIVAQGSRDIPFDFCQTAREKINLHLTKIGRYELVVGLRGRLERRLPVIVEEGAPMVLQPNMISGKTPLNKQELLGRAERGETIVIMPREDYPAWLPGELITTTRSPAVNFTFRPEHPLLKGIDQRELSYWYPRHRTGRGYFFKPRGGNSKTIVEAGGMHGLTYAGLLEVPYGKGGFVYCALDLEPEVNPIAARLLRNLSQYKIASTYRPAGLMASASSPLAMALARNGVCVEQATFKNMDAYSVLIVDGKEPIGPLQLKQLEEFKGTVLVQDPSADYGVVKQPFLQQEWQGRAIRIGYFPELAGLTNQDMFFRKEAVSENILQSFVDPKFLLDVVGTAEIQSGGTPMLYPAYLARRGNLLFSTLNWTTTCPDVKDQTRTIISRLMTNLGVKVKPAIKLELPKKLRYRCIDVSRFLDREMKDDVPEDGKGGFSDQGDVDMREFQLKGVQTLADIPFRLEYPKACFALKSRYGKGGYERVDVPINSTFKVLAWLHTGTFVFRVPHYSVIVNYEDGSKYDIVMMGRANMWDFAEAPKRFLKETDTITKVAWQRHLKNRKRARIALYRTAWINPAPGKKVTSITFLSKNQGIPIILALSLGSERRETKVTPALNADYQKLVNKGLALQQAKQYKAAIQAYSQALEMIPERLEIYRSIGACYEFLKDYRKALQTYQKSLEEDYNQPDLWDRCKDMKEKLK